MADEKRNVKDLFVRFMEIFNAGEAERLEEVFDQDIVVDWPQSKERIKGLANVKAVLRNFPDKPEASQTRFMGEDSRYLLTPMFTTVKVEGTGDNVISTMKLKYPDGSDWYVISLMIVRDSKFVKMIQYYAPFYEAPQWRSQWVEITEDDT
ncbi:MAG TPA: nuclear transport factor 2 family protein [Terriglobales bacterium]|jgi:hypothetical protein|nr:nuclear transport factor 2 family protein [Terriglobales bacterium]